jgi:hypothetical protein
MLIPTHPAHKQLQAHLRQLILEGLQALEHASLICIHFEQRGIGRRRCVLRGGRCIGMPRPLVARTLGHEQGRAEVQRLAAARDAPADVILRARIVAAGWDGACPGEITWRFGCDPTRRCAHGSASSTTRASTGSMMPRGAVASLGIGQDERSRNHRPGWLDLPAVGCAAARLTARTLVAPRCALWVHRRTSLTRSGRGMPRRMRRSSFLTASTPGRTRNIRRRISSACLVTAFDGQGDLGFLSEFHGDHMV